MVDAITHLPATEKFNPQLHRECGSGRLYWTTVQYMHQALKYGTKVGEIELPTKAQDPKHRTIRLCNGTKFGSSSLILKKLYDLYDEATYARYGLTMTLNLSIVIFALREGKLDFLKLYHSKLDCNDDIILRSAQHLTTRPLKKIEKWTKEVSDQNVFDWLMQVSPSFKLAVEGFQSYHDVSCITQNDYNNGNSHSYMPRYVGIPWMKAIKIATPSYFRLVCRHEGREELLTWLFQDGLFWTEMNLQTVADFLNIFKPQLINAWNKYEKDDDDDACYDYSDRHIDISWMKTVVFFLKHYRDGGNVDNYFTQAIENSWEAHTFHSGHILLDTESMHEESIILWKEYMSLLVDIMKKKSIDKSLFVGPTWGFKSLLVLGYEELEFLHSHKLLDSILDKVTYENRFLSITCWNDEDEFPKYRLLKCYPCSIDTVYNACRIEYKQWKYSKCVENILSWSMECRSKEWFKSQKQSDLQKLSNWLLNNVPHVSVRQMID